MARKTETETTPGVDEATLDRLIERRMRLRDAQARVSAAQLADERRRTAEEAHERSFIGGPCVYCGVTRSAVIYKPNVERYLGLSHITRPPANATKPGPPEERPYWGTVEDLGQCCIQCDNDRRNTLGGYILPDNEHRDHVVRRLVGPELARWYLPGYLAAKVGFKWWYEAPDAAGTNFNGAPRTRRFGHLSIETLRDAARIDVTPNPYASGEPCSRCGCAHMWANVQRTEVYLGDDGNEKIRVFESRRCMGCAWAPALGDVAARLIGINLDRREYRNTNHGVVRSNGGTTVGIGPGEVGVDWYTHRRSPVVPVRTGPAVHLTPFAYLDVEAIRRQAYEKYPDERWWVNKNVWQRLHAEAESRCGSA